MKFQQFTSPVMAKGLEDTSAYIYHRLLSLNEVGGDPRQFGVTLRAFHRANQARAEHWPHAMLTTSTHDTKRSEDVRARLNVLSEIPAAWRLALRHWSRRQPKPQAHGGRDTWCPHLTMSISSIRHCLVFGRQVNRM